MTVPREASERESDDQGKASTAKGPRDGCLEEQGKVNIRWGLGA